MAALRVDRRKEMALLIVVILVLAGGLLLITRPPTAPPVERATIDDLLSSKSTRAPVDYDGVFTPLNSGFLALVATPIACYYEGSTETIVPLLVVGENMETQDHGISRSVLRFLEAYPMSKGIAIGAIPCVGSCHRDTIDMGSVVGTSLAAAERFWTRSDGAILIKEDQEGYNLGVIATPLASYLNIPVIIVKKTSDAIPTLKRLGVRYVLECGRLEPYKRTWQFRSVEEINEAIALGVKASDGEVKSVLKTRLGTNCTYITLTNPIDSHHPRVLETNVSFFEGTLISKDTGSTYYPTAEDPCHELIIPDDWNYTNVIIDSYMPFTTSPDPRRNPDLDGQRMYVYFGLDENRDNAMDKMEFFAPSLAYESVRDSSGNAVAAHAYMEHPIFHPGRHIVQIAGTLHMQFPVNLPFEPPLSPPTTTYNITVTVQRLEDPIFPYIHNMSSMAPYLTAHRRGVVIGRAEWAVNGEGPGVTCSCDPLTSEEGMLKANNASELVKMDLNAFLARLEGLEPGDYSALAVRYAGKLPEAFPVAILGDPSMVPWFYYPTAGQEDVEQEGLGIPSDNFYADIDADPANPPFELDGSEPSMELAIGRVIGWDVQDQSALIARTFFYESIIDTFEGHSGRSWKESALNTFGSKVPVGLAVTVTTKLNQAWRQAGYVVDTRHDTVLSDRRFSAPYYERSNFIFFCAHGFFYWYVPPGYQKDGVGGGFDVAHVKDMNFGPSVIFGSSCVTGRVDGLPAYNTLSQTFLHSGMNAYVGASRLSWGGFSPLQTKSGEVYGDYLGLLFFGYLTGYVYNKEGGLVSEGVGDLTVAQALLLAKNKYVQDCGTDGGGAHDDTVEEFNLFGDPMFNPYEPNHDG
ncbi:MAG: C25 family cysteine peptidase [Thermoplasmata archaeon]